MSYTQKAVNLLTQAKQKRGHGVIAKIAKDTGLNPSWVSKLQKGGFDDAGADKVMKIIAYLESDEFK